MRMIIPQVIRQLANHSCRSIYSKTLTRSSGYSRPILLINSSDIFCKQLNTMVNEEVYKTKKLYLDMNIEDKRKIYKCAGNYVTIDSVPNWTEYYNKHKEELPTFESTDKTFEVNSVLNGKVSLWQGDITKLEIDSIVNAANKSLLGGGGVDGAIHRAAGKDLLAECKLLNGCDTGESKISGGYKLPTKYIIHTVGPIGENSSKLQSCYKNSLNILLENNLKTIAFPCISTGVYGYPPLNAAHVALETSRAILEKNSDKIERIIFCVFLPEDLSIYQTLLQKYFPVN